MANIEKYFSEETKGEEVLIENQIANSETERSMMADLKLADAVSSKALASLAGRVLRAKNIEAVSLEDAQRLAGSVLRQYVEYLKDLGK